MNDSDSNLSSQVSNVVPETMDSVIDLRLVVLMVLVVATFFVAIKTVVHRHEARTLFVEMQKLEKERDVLAAEWSSLKLEQGTVLNQVNVERLARRDLGMKMPKTSDIQLIREPETIAVVDSDSVVSPLKQNSMKEKGGKNGPDLKRVSLSD